MRSRTALLALCLAAGCTDRQARNPLDPGATGVDPAVVVGPLEAVAGDGQVQLRWNYQAFEDIAGYRLYRRTGKEEQLPYRELEPADTALVDEAVENGLTYQYQLALLIRGEGERRLTPLRLATPGPQAAWAADPGSGLVWRIAPDNRAPFFAHGRFPGLNGIGVDRRDGSCWVSDASYRGAIRIGADGKLSQHPGRIGEPGPLAVDPQSGEGWLVDRAEQTVLWFALPAGEDSLRFEVVDARFAGLRVLEALDGSCWIGDGERLLRYWRQGNRRREWEVRGTTALAPTREGGAWVLVEQGQGLVLRTRRGNQGTGPALCPGPGPGGGPGGRGVLGGRGCRGGVAGRGGRGAGPRRGAWGVPGTGPGCAPPAAVGRHPWTLNGVGN